MGERQGGGRVRAAARPLRSAGVTPALLGILLGCASPGPPRAPSLRLPEKAERLAAQRTADTVALSWVTPARTTDGNSIMGGMTAVVCREELPPAARRGRATGCTEISRQPAAPGPANATDKLPESLRTGPARLLAYRVELLNVNGRSAGACDPVFAAAGEAPAAVGALTLTPEREAVLLNWPREPGAGPHAAMQVMRTLLATPAGPVAEAKPAPQPAGQQPGAPRGRRTGGARKGNATLGSSGLRRDEARNDNLETLTDAGTGMQDAGGMVDRTVQDGDTYRYAAQRVRRVTLDGHALELRGAASPPATLLYRDTFPPDAPTGLLAAPGGGFDSPAEIDLSWEPGAEGNLLGYNVYRSSGADGSYTRLNAEPLTAAAYRDQAVQAGREYVYRVTALDRLHHEGAPSSEVHEILRE